MASPLLGAQAKNSLLQRFSDFPGLQTISLTFAMFSGVLDVFVGPGALLLHYGSSFLIWLWTHPRVALSLGTAPRGPMFKYAHKKVAEQFHRSTILNKRFIHKFTCPDTEWNDRTFTSIPIPSQSTSCLKFVRFRLVTLYNAIISRIFFII